MEVQTFWTLRAIETEWGMDRKLLLRLAEEGMLTIHSDPRGKKNRYKWIEETELGVCINELVEDPEQRAVSLFCRVKHVACPICGRVRLTVPYDSSYCSDKCVEAKRLRERNEVSLRDAAERLGVSPAKIRWLQRRSFLSYPITVDSFNRFVTLVNRSGMPDSESEREEM